MVAILILSSLYDFATDEVAYVLDAEGASYVRLNVEQLPNHKISLDPLEPTIRVDGPVGCHVIGPELKAVLFRQPVFLRSTSTTPLSIPEQLRRTQWQSFLQSLSLFQGAGWMNFPASTYLAESKPNQLRVAHESGFAVPRTVVTNDPLAITELFPDRMAIKSIDTVLLHDGRDTLFAYTTERSADELTDENLRQAPVIAQEYLREKTDIRVTIVGEDLFAVKVLADGERVEGDWRRVPKERLSYVDYRLPDECVTSCLALMRKLGLKFGAIDMALVDDKLVFIEINPTGEWGWLSSDDRPIGRSIASWLTSV